MVDKTADSILVKEGGVEINFLFHFNSLISQCYFYKEIMIPYTIKPEDHWSCIAHLSAEDMLN